MSNKEYVLSKINSVEVSNDPWRHVIIYDFLPQDLYDQIKEETGVYLQRKELRGQEGKGIRAWHLNVNKSQGVYPDASEQPGLREYYDILSDPDIEKAIKLKANLEGYHNDNLSEDMWSSFDIQSSGFVYDEVHADHESKIHTLIHYLADEGDDESLGTTMYSPDIPGLQQDVEKDFVSRAKFIPNSVLIFSPCRKKGHMTNHAMLHLSEKTAFRKTLQTFWMKSKENWTGAQKGRIKL
jgi:hypothetical protein